VCVFTRALTCTAAASRPAAATRAADSDRASWVMVDCSSDASDLHCSAAPAGAWTCQHTCTWYMNTHMNTVHWLGSWTPYMHRLHTHELASGTFLCQQAQHTHIHRHKLTAPYRHLDACLTPTAISTQAGPHNIVITQQHQSSPTPHPRHPHPLPTQ
jgi:hypothetical protein